MDKYSLHFGLNDVDKSIYIGNYRPLKNAENDARTYNDIAQQNNFKPRIFLGPNATSLNLSNALEELAATMIAGDLLFLSYSGHGTKVPDLNNDEPDHMDEVLVLFDRLFIDDEFPHYWKLFKPGTKILFINDSCFNGSVSHLFLNKKPIKNHLDKGYVFRGIDTEQANPDYQKNLEYYKNIQRLTVHPACSIIHIGSCRDNQLASDGEPTAKNGRFTAKFKSILNSSSFTGNYAQFYQTIKKQMPIVQIPTWDTSAGTPHCSFQNDPFLK